MKNKLKILFVGYDTKSLKVSQQALQQLGHKDFSYSLTGESCLHRLDKTPRVIFIDSNDEELAGLDVIKRIKALSPQSCVVMLLNRNNLKLAHLALKNGAFDYMLKGNAEARQIQNIVIEIQEVETEKARNKKGKTSFLRKMFGLNFSFSW